MLCRQALVGSGGRIVSDSTSPTHRLFSKQAWLTPVRVEKYDYLSGLRFAFLYVFGVRVASWNMAASK